MMDKRVVGLRRRRSRLISYIHRCRQYKEYVVTSRRKLRSEYAKREITYEQYSSKSQQLLGGTAVKDWIDYYDRLIVGYQAKIKETTIRMEELKQKTTRNLVMFGVMVVVLSMLGLYAFNDARTAGEAGQTLVNVTIINVAPNVTRAFITPPVPDTTRDLTCLAESVFDMNEDEVALYYRWFKNSMLVESQNNRSVLESTNTARFDNWTCEITPFDGELNGAPKNASVSITGMPPVLEEWNLTPLFPYTSDNLTLTVRCSDVDFGEEITAYWNIYNNSDLEASYSKIVQNGIAENVTVVDSSMTAKAQAWFAEAWCGDNETNTSRQNTSKVIVQNTRPTVSLLSPADGNSTLFERRVTFNYTSNDMDLDDILYELNISTFGSTVIGRANIPASSFTLQDPLDVDTEYGWSVRAYDGEEYGDWSKIWNFSVASYMIIDLLANETTFGEVDIGVTQDTVSGPALPFLVENMGNIEADIVLFAAEQLFSNALLGTEYFRYMAGISTEPGSFLWSSSQTTWRNITGAFTPVIHNLKYQDENDTAEIEFLVTVPPLEPSGEKRTTIIVGGEAGE